MLVHRIAGEERLWLVAAGGRLDAQAVPELEEALRVPLDRDADAMIVDLSEANYISSSGLKAIVSIWRTLHGRGGRLVLAGLGPRLREIFDMVGFTQILEVFPDAAAAEASLRGAALGAPDQPPEAETPQPPLQPPQQ